MFVAVLASIIACNNIACNKESAAMSNTPSSPSTMPILERVHNAKAKADTVIEAIVVSVGTAPGSWSGRLAVYQQVIYRVTSIIFDHTGRVRENTELTVDHLIVAGSETADVQPHLRPDLVARGNRAIVILRWQDGRWIGIDEHVGVVAATEDVRRAVAQ